MFNKYHYTEWESLQNNITLYDIKSDSMDFTKNTSITLYRKSLDYHDYYIEGLINNKIENINLNQRPGAIIPYLNIWAEDELYNYKLEMGFSNKAKVKVNSLEKEMRKVLNTEFLIEWYINGPSNTNFIWPRATSREITYKKKRVNNNIVYPDYPITDYSIKGGFTKDYAFIKCDKFGFIIFLVPDGLGPSWSNNIGIEYRKEYGEIPEDKTRIAISDIISFIFGAKIIKVGSARFVESGFPVKELLYSPFTYYKIPPSNKSPIFIRNIEDLLSSIIPNFLDAYEKYDFFNVFLRYWIAEGLPIGINLPVLSSALDIIVDKWCKFNDLPRIYIDKKDYLNDIKEDINRLYKKIENFDYINTKFDNDLIKNDLLNKTKVETFNEISWSAQLRYFFKKIGIELSPLEIKAIKMRHSMAHGRFKRGSWESDKDSVLLTDIYRTILNKVILKLIGYNGKYIDYSKEGWPERSLE